MMIRNAIGPYQVVRLLGHGGMGEVYEAIAHGASGFSRRVAIKLAHDLVGSPDVVPMLIAEANLGGGIHHQNIVAVLNLGVDDGVYYLVLELVDGGDLGAHLTGPLSPALALFVVEQVALGLAHLHALRDDRGLPLGVIHRDVRPGNVLVSTTGDVKLADLGIAKVTARITRTVSGTRKGHYNYMAPEQLAAEPLSAATDQFGLAVTAAELLCGHRPFPDANPWELLDGRRQPPDLTGIPAELSPILARALAFSPADRFGSVDAFRAALSDPLPDHRRADGPELGAWVAESLLRRA